MSFRPNLIRYPVATVIHIKIHTDIFLRNFEVIRTNLDTDHQLIFNQISCDTIGPPPVAHTHTHTANYKD